MHLIVYTSKSTSDKNRIDAILQDIVQVAKKKNKERAITGVLFYDNHRYLQFIEGEKDQLLILMDELYQDDRHQDINELINEPVSERELMDWNMDYFNIDKNNELSESLLERFRDIYKSNVVLSSKGFVDFIKSMLAEPELMRIMNA